MANPSDMRNQLEARKTEGELTIFEKLDKMTPAIQKAFGDEERYAIQFVRQARTLMQMNPKLQACTPESLFGAMMLSAQLKLQLNPGLNTAFLVPYERKTNRDGKWVVTHTEAQFQIGYGGYLELFYRHEKSVSLDVYTVFEGDDFSFSLGTDARIHHIPNMKEQGDPYAWYAVATLAGGHKKFLVMSKNQIMQNAKKSQAWDSYKNCFKPKSSWESDFDGMAKKTVIKMLAKTLPLSTDLAVAVAQDGAVKNYREGTSIIDAPSEEYIEPPMIAEVNYPDPAKEVVPEPEPEKEPGFKPLPDRTKPIVKSEPKPRTTRKCSECGIVDGHDPTCSHVAPALSPIEAITEEYVAFCNQLGSQQLKDQLVTDTGDLVESRDVSGASAKLKELKAKYGATDKQIGMIRGLLHKLTVDITAVYDVAKVTDLTKFGASEVIGKLKEMEGKIEDETQGTQSEEIPLPSEPVNGKDIPF